MKIMNPYLVETTDTQHHILLQNTDINAREVVSRAQKNLVGLWHWKKKMPKYEDLPDDINKTNLMNLGSALGENNKQFLKKNTVGMNADMAWANEAGVTLRKDKQSVGDWWDSLSHKNKIACWNKATNNAELPVTKIK